MMSDPKEWTCALATAVLLAAPTGAAERVLQLNLVTQHDPADKAQVQAVGEHEYEWSLPDGLGQTLNIDLRKLGVDPHDYDELRFDIKPLGSQVALHATLFGMPTEDELTSWYTKFKTATDQWSTGRFDLRVDDDGAQYPERFGDFRPGVLRLELGRRLLGYPGEPQWRKAILRNPRLIRWVVAVDFEPRDVKIVTNDVEVAYTYGLRVKNRADQPATATVEVDPDHGLKSFAAGPAGPLTVDLAAGEEKTVPIRLAISQKQARELAPGYGERICPKVWVEGLPDSDVQPLLGYRRMPMWAVVPVTKPAWTPQTFQARVAEAAKFMSVAAWREDILHNANEVLKYDWPAFDWLAPGLKADSSLPFWGQSYRCPACKADLRSDPPNDIHRHVCKGCGKIIENHSFYDQCARQECFRRRFADLRMLAMAWLLTDDARYADKALAIALAYADAHPTMSLPGYRSTGGSSRLGKNTLVASWALPDLAEGCSMLASYPGLTQEKRKRWDTLLIDEGLRLARHSGEYNNQQAEYIRAYGSIALVTGYWPLLGEALHGDFGWDGMVEYGYSEDGIGHEGQAYHMALWGAMSRFAAFASERGLDLMTPRFKRIYDGSLAMGYGDGAIYELAYRECREPAYLTKIEAGRKNPSEAAILTGVPDAPHAASVPAVSKLMDGMGYIFLRRGNAADSCEIHLNYKEQFDRGEQDRFTTFFYRNGAQVDATVARISYTAPGAGWMAHAAAHNVIVIDGQDSRAVTANLVAYDGDGDTPFAVVAADPKATLYEGVLQLRGIAILGDAYVVFDRVTCDRPRTVDRYQWGKGKATLGFQAVTPAAVPGRLPEAGRYTDVLGGACGKELRVTFENGLKMRLVCDQDMMGYKALSFGGYMGLPMEVTWARLDDVREATFLAVFSLGKDAEPPGATIVKSADDGIVLDVKAKDQGWTVTVRPKEGKAEIVAR